MIRSIAILLLLASAAHGQTVDVSAYCPAMPITRLSLVPNVWECAREVGTGTAKLPSKTLTFREFVIPPTLVRKVVIGHMVDACNQFGFSDDMDQLSIDLPRERVVLGVAERMTARATLTLHDGTEFRGSVVYPACRSRRVGIGQREAEEVTAYGKVTIYSPKGTP